MIDKIKKALEPQVNKWFYNWVFKIDEEGCVCFHRKDNAVSSDHVLYKDVFDTDDFDEVIEFIAERINYYNNRFPFKPIQDYKRQEIMERRKWLNRKLQR